MSKPARSRRGTTLIEVLIVLAIVAMVMSVVVIGFGAVGSARLKHGSTKVAGAIRVAYAHATAVSNVVRLTFDFAEAKIYLEEAQGRHFLRKDASGGSEQIEEQARSTSKAAELRAPRASFKTVGTLGFPEEGVELPSGIGFWSVDTGHQQEALFEGKAYLYFFPGGQTESASIQVRVSNAAEEDTSDFMTVTVSPLTGKSFIHRGRVPIPKSLDEAELSDAEDPGT